MMIKKDLGNLFFLTKCRAILQLVVEAKTRDEEMAHIMRTSILRKVKTLIYKIWLFGNKVVSRLCNMFYIGNGEIKKITLEKISFNKFKV